MSHEQNKALNEYLQKHYTGTLREAMLELTETKQQLKNLLAEIDRVIGTEPNKFTGRYDCWSRYQEDKNLAPYLPVYLKLREEY